MMKPICVLILVSAVGCVSAAAADARSGEAVFMKSCRMCHGPQGQGNPALAKTLNVTIPDLRSKEVQAKSDDELAKTIAQGKGKMKPVQSVSADSARDVVLYVRTLAK